MMCLLLYPVSPQNCSVSLYQVPADEVCGCPITKDVFESTGDFCRVPKRKCNRHYCWEKLRRAEVDLERVRVVCALSYMSICVFAEPHLHGWKNLILLITS